MLKISKDQLISDVRFALGKKQLTADKDFKLEAKVGGGSKVLVVKFKKSEHVQEHRGVVENALKNTGFTAEIKVAA